MNVPRRSAVRLAVAAVASLALALLTVRGPVGRAQAPGSLVRTLTVTELKLVAAKEAERRRLFGAQVADDAAGIPGASSAPAPASFVGPPQPVRFYTDTVSVSKADLLRAEEVALDEATAVTLGAAEPATGSDASGDGNPGDALAQDEALAGARALADAATMRIAELERLPDDFAHTFAVPSVEIGGESIRFSSYTYEGSRQSDPVNVVFYGAASAWDVDYDMRTWTSLRWTTTTDGQPNPTLYPNTPTQYGTSCRGQLLAEYFSGRNPTGTPVFSRCEASPIDRRWYAGGPGRGVGSDNFSARWTGRVHFDGGRYTFTARTDDGMRVWVGGVAIFDKWWDQSETRYSATFNIYGGDYDIRVDYYERSGFARAGLRWDPAVECGTVQRMYIYDAANGGADGWRNQTYQLQRDGGLCGTPRYHVRLFQGFVPDPHGFGTWTAGGAHHDGWLHVPDGWESAETAVRNSFTNVSGAPFFVGRVWSVSLNNAGTLQGQYNDGVATYIELIH
jgi:hypothetical protein